MTDKSKFDAANDSRLHDLGPDPDSIPTDSFDHPELSALAISISRIGIALFVVFIAAIVIPAMPVRLLSSDWQLTLIGSLVNNAYIAALGFVLVCLAPFISPALESIWLWQVRSASVAVYVSIGYFLLIPLQGFALWQGLNTFSIAKDRQINRSTSQIQAIQSVVNESASTLELQRRLSVLKAPPLTPADMAMDLKVLRPQILANLETAKLSVTKKYSGLSSDQIQTMVKESIRVIVSSLAYGFGFAAAARHPGQEFTMLDSWIYAFKRLRKGPRQYTIVKQSNPNITDDEYNQMMNGDDYI